MLTFALHGSAPTRASLPIFMDISTTEAPSKPTFTTKVPKTDEGFTYDSDAFMRYGGSSAWFNNLQTSFNSRVLERIQGHLTATICAAAAVSLAYEGAELGSLPTEVAAIVQGCALPALPHEAVGSIIGLLLAFRTGQAYDRFWEGRTLWDGVYGSTRSIVRLTAAAARSAPPATASTADERASWVTEQARISSLVVGLSVAFPYALKQHLRGERQPEELIDAAIAATGAPPRSPLSRQLAFASRQPNVPLAVLDRLTRALLPLRTEQGELLWWQLDAKVEELISILGKAERIKGTPVPLSYSRHTSRFFSIYAFTLPLALVGKVALLGIPPIVAVISWVIFATEEIGHIIEEPFGRGLTEDPDMLPTGSEEGDGSALQLEVLPLGRYCADIASDAATIFQNSPTFFDEMPGGDDEIDLFDNEA